MNFISSLAAKVQNVTTDEAAADAVEKIATKVTYTASAGTVISGLTINEWGVVVGMILGISTFAFKVWFDLKYRKGQRHDQDRR